MHPNPKHRTGASFATAMALVSSLLFTGSLAVAQAGGAAALGGVDLSGKSGPAVHSALSPFKPLVERKDVLSWSALTEVKTRTEKNKVLPVFSMPVMAMNQKIQRVQGFMLPLEPGERQTHFLLSQVPLSCNFCTPGGPESMIEVRTKTPVKYGFDAVVVEGRFNVLADDLYGMYYRMTDAVAVK